MMSSGVIYFFLNVLMPTAKAISQPVILPSLRSDLLQETSFLHVLMSPESRAHYKDAKNAYSPKFSVGWLAKSSYFRSVATVTF